MPWKFVRDLRFHKVLFIFNASTPEPLDQSVILVWKSGLQLVFNLSPGNYSQEKKSFTCSIRKWNLLGHHDTALENGQVFFQ